MMTTPESIQILINSEDLGDRLRAVNQLRDIEPQTAYDLIQTAIKDQNARVRYAAVSQLASLGNQNLTKSEEILRGCLLHDPEADVQAAAADAIGGLKLKSVFEDLQQVYHNTPEWLVKMSIVAALGEMGEPQAFEILKDALQQDNGLIQTVAISALGELGNPDAVALLIPYATDEDWQVRYRVVQSLNRLGGSQAEETLKQLSQDSVPQVAGEALRGMS
ncbi:MAG: HEAT repeat domain-containing protein [Microcoleaceae cyanobacterium]